MATPKYGTKHFHLDMTAFSDVAFLLLIFCFYSFRFRPQEPAWINPPASTWGGCRIDDAPHAYILIGQGKVFVDIPDDDTRHETMKNVTQKCKINLTPAEMDTLSKTVYFGMYASQIKQFLSFDERQRSQLLQPGIPMNESNHELANWIYEARKATKKLYHQELRIGINADEKESYTLVKQVMDILNKQNIHRFELITSTKHEHSYSN